MSKKLIKKIGIVMAIASLIAAYKIFNLNQYFTLSYLKASQEKFLILYTEHRLPVIASYMGIYTLVTSLSLPGPAVMTLAGGALFGFWLGTLAVSFAGAEKEVLLKTSQGEMLPLRSEVILVAVGRSANTEGLGLQNIGVKYDRKGIKVDEKRRTDHNHIYAIGDVNGGYLFTHVAGYEGSVVIRNAVFHLPQKVDYTFLPWCTYTDPELANIGLNEKAAKAAGLQYSVWTEEFKANDRSMAEGQAVGKIKMILDKKEKPLGIQIFGPHAGELINEWVVALNGGMKLSTLASSVHPYPTLGEINKHVVGTFLSTKVFSETVKKGLHFLFRLKGSACKQQVS